MSPRWEQVEEIFNRALEHDSGTRAAFLEEACAGDAALRQEVVSLLRYEKAAERFIEAPAIEALAGEVGRSDDPLPAGHQIGPYTVISLLGEGGMGEVYRARHTKLGRDVAIKALPASFALDLRRVRRLEREARLLASLNHRNIAAIYGVEEALGMQFLILELVEGQTLAERLEDGPVPPEEGLRLARQIARALRAAHARDVVHRDLTPSNICVTPYGDVKVLDFGLARVTSELDEPSASPDPGGGTDEEVTQHGAVMGTVAYMSPEQAGGGRVDARTDVWAFGCVLYEILTGHPVWEAESPEGLREAARSGEPDFGRLPGSLGPDIRVLLSRCLEKDASKRPDDAAEVLAEFEKSLGHRNGRWPNDIGDSTGAASVRLGSAFALLTAGALWALWRSVTEEESAGVCGVCGSPVPHPHRETVGDD